MDFSSIVTYGTIDYSAEFNFISIDYIELIGNEELLRFLNVEKLLFSYNTKDLILHGSTINGEIELVEPIFKALMDKLIELEYI